MSKTIRTLAMLAMIVPIVACAPTDTSESTGEFLDDSVITIKVKNAIIADPALKVLQIRVATFKGRVQMSGFVDSQQMIAHAGAVVADVEGVKSVQNDLIAK
ncbi:BON domain-containing protein [Magnetospirillum sp. 15-1]|uniref:BON domain-containing protein n=1 Tax=Magnetospirillum sp. 15-1 TaxID=1979370 RepID=UPI000BBC9ACC|nr:BON domain-containing protein [Magnetospirillum sp. 15-1]